ncbi:MAG: tryptophan synthase subunit alpha [Caldilinea sp.]
MVGCLAMVRELRTAGMTQPFCAMTYYNPLFACGVQRFVDDAVAAGIDGLIVPDLPPEEAEELEAACRVAGLATVYLLAPTSTLMADHTGNPVGAPLAGAQGETTGAPDDTHDQPHGRPQGRPQGSPLQAGAQNDTNGRPGARKIYLPRNECIRSVWNFASICCMLPGSSMQHLPWLGVLVLHLLPESRSQNSHAVRDSAP